MYFYREIYNDVQLVSSNSDMSQDDDRFIQIEQPEYNKFCKDLKNGKLLWLDKQGNLHSRNKLTKYDESTDAWIPDNEAIAADKVQQEKNRQLALQAQAKQCLLATDYQIVADTFAEFTETEQSQILAYRKYLRDVMNNKVDLANITELKTMDKF